MWPLCTANNFLWLLIPLLIGLLTGWWAWGRRGAAEPEAYSYGGGSAPTPAPAPPPVAPVREPETLRTATVEPIRPAPAPVSAAPAAAAAATVIGIPAAVGASDDLTQIVGIGPKLNEVLAGLGVRRFDQIAAWGASEIAKVDSHLGSFTGRIERDKWIDQAKLLASGAIEEWNRRFGGGTNT